MKPTEQKVFGIILLAGCLAAVLVSLAAVGFFGRVPPRTFLAYGLLYNLMILFYIAYKKLDSGPMEMRWSVTILLICSVVVSNLLVFLIVGQILEIV